MSACLSVHSYYDCVLHIAPEDFLGQSGTVVLMSTSTMQCLSIPIIDDSIDEADQECFTISLSEISGKTDFTLTPAVATVCIHDTGGRYRMMGLHYFPVHSLMLSDP